jgi:glycine cleavage system aminomethyltransferase T
MLFKEDEIARAEATAVRENAAWYRWTHDLVKVTGEDAEKFLDWILVNSIAGLSVGRGKYTTMLDENGGIIDDLVVFHKAEGLWWLSTLYGPRLIPWLEAHAEGRDVSARLVTYDWDMYAVQGPDAPAAMEKLLDESADGMKRFSVSANAVDGIPVYVHRSGFTGEDGFEIYCAAEKTAELREKIAAAVEAAGGREIYTLEVYVRSIPMEKGFALKQDFKHLNPFECGLGWAVDLEKDFIGKDATLAIKDKPRYQMVGLEFERESTEDVNIWERVYLYGVEVGRCAQAIYGYTVDRNIGFATVRAGIPEGTRVTVGPNGSPAVIVKKKFC